MILLVKVEHILFLIKSQSVPHVKMFWHLVSICALVSWFHQRTWRQSRESQRCWGLRNQWGAPWCHQPAQSTVREIVNVFKSMLFQEFLMTLLEPDKLFLVMPRISRSTGYQKLGASLLMENLPGELAACHSCPASPRQRGQCWRRAASLETLCEHLHLNK